MFTQFPEDASHVFGFSSPNFDFDSGIEFMTHFVVFADDDGEQVGGDEVEFSTVDAADRFVMKVAKRFSVPAETDFCDD